MHTQLIPHASVHTALSERGESLNTLLTHNPLETTVCIQPVQVHQANYIVIDQSNCTTLTPEADAVITTLPHMTLAIRHADCLPILLFHPRGLIAAIHAGRKGTQAQITKKTLRAIKKQFGITQGLQLWLGPALCTECHRYNNNTAQFDLITENIQQIQTVFPQDTATITHTAYCTAHDKGLFYSYRADGAGVPMNWSVITRLY